MNQKLRVIDFFCGAGGFSEGFRQQGFQIVMGIDNWQPAIETHNLNHKLNDLKKDILIFASSIDEINGLPDTEIIIGSPPCVLFSHSNAGGNRDKTLGIELIETFLKIVAVKKHQPSSKLVAWFLENVPNSKNYIKPTYTFRELNLAKWARSNNINPDKIALKGTKNGQVVNTADFGVPQNRKRFVCGEIIATGEFPDLGKFIEKRHKSLAEVINKMPPPNAKPSNKLYADPNYPCIKLIPNKITDHFYDTGLYESQWKSAKYSKTNHPYMGSMSFPENLKNPSRTIMATRSMSSRETMIYKSEYDRKGNGEYRLPTIREIATLMGFPYSYQFSGAEHSKWRQVGNAICPGLSAILAKSVRISLGLKTISDNEIKFNDSDKLIPKICNLNTFTEKKLVNPPVRKPKARFRRHMFKDGNMTVALTNYDPLVSSGSISSEVKWYSSIFLGTGRGFETIVIPKNGFKEIGRTIEKEFGSLGKKFVISFESKFKNFFGKSHMFQDAYVNRNKLTIFEPERLIDEIGDFILRYNFEQKFIRIANVMPNKKKVPSRQVLAMYAINRIVS